MKYHVSKKFSSFDEFNSFTHGWDADFSANTKAECQAQIEQVHSDGVLINTGSYTQATIQRGTTPSGMHTFAIPFWIRGPMYWRNIPVITNSLMVFPKDRELYAAAKGPVSICSISVAEDLVAKQLSLCSKNVSHALNTGRAWQLQTCQWQSLHKSMHVYSEFVTQQGDHGQHSGLRESLEEDLLVSMLDLLLESVEEVAPIRPEAAAKNTQRALDYLREQGREPVVIADLCSAVGISRRVLELSFKKYIGQSPKQYSNHQRLRHCNEELRRTSPKQKSVNQVAISWGFWHMGQFGHDYKKLFGQTPGTTLAEYSG
jgi:AraC family ethanolamine operon transcriptional activator